jgi:biotin synthase
MKELNQLSKTNIAVSAAIKFEAASENTNSENAQKINSEALLRHDFRLEEILQLFELPFNDLIFKAAEIHRRFHNPNAVQISTLLSIKTGSCPENCKYCPQSAHYNTGLKKEALMTIDKILTAAKSAKEEGASRFCMGAAWRNLHDRDVEKICRIVEEVKKTGLETCMTLGMLTYGQSVKLKEAGLDYYNHNIDTSPEFYSEIISSRNFSDRLNTIENVRQAGLKVCCGGIIGMGEKLEDRAKMLLILANLEQHPQSVPINMLVKVKGTPLDSVADLSQFEFIRTIAVARIMMPKSTLRLSAGRENMNEQTQALCFLSGANSIFYGEKLLTTTNPQIDSDKSLFKELGIAAK